jgi:hypothetical protein
MPGGTPTLGIDPAAEGDESGAPEGDESGAPEGDESGAPEGDESGALEPAARIAMAALSSANTTTKQHA